MIIDYNKKIAFLSNTKVASTSLEKALMSLGIQMGRIDGTSEIKHLKLIDFLNIKDTLSANEFRTTCVIRHPISKAMSWYKYRARDELIGRPRSTKGVPLEKFLSTIPTEDFDDRHFVYDAKRGKSVDMIFKYEHLDVMVEFLKGIYGEKFQLEHLNKSPELALEKVSSSTLARFQDAVDWYESLPNAPDLSNAKR